MFAKLATEFAKDPQSDIASNIRKLAGHMRLKEAFEESSSRKNKFM